MTKLIVIDRDGQQHDVPSKPGLKVMETLRDLDYGVAAICGGMCSCATCHIYVDQDWLAKLPAPMSDERELLSELSHYKENSRLSCQVEMTEAISGLRVTIAPDE
jgi:ferredoxin, 2Fe-2S